MSDCHFWPKTVQLIPGTCNDLVYSVYYLFSYIRRYHNLIILWTNFHLRQALHWTATRPATCRSGGRWFLAIILTTPALYSVCINIRPSHCNQNWAENVERDVPTNIQEVFCQGSSNCSVKEMSKIFQGCVNFDIFKQQVGMYRVSPKKRGIRKLGSE